MHLSLLKSIFILSIFCTSLYAQSNAEYESKIKERMIEVKDKLDEKSKLNQIDEEYRWFQGYLCALEYVLEIIED
jgi:hypothetical protein